MVMNDVTESKQADQARRETEEHFRELVQNVNCAIIRLKNDGTVTFISDCALNFLGYHQDEVIGRNANILLPLEQPIDLKFSTVIRNIVFNPKRLKNNEIESVCRDGSKKWMAWSNKFMLDDNGQVVEIIAAGNDITKQKQVEEALYESKAKLEAVLAGMTDAVFIADAQGEFVDFNEAFATFHKFDSKEECARVLAERPDILEVYTANGNPATLDMWAVPRALRGEIGTNVEYTLRRKDSGETWVGSYSFSPIRDIEGSIVGAVVSGRDITEQKNLESTLKESEESFQLLFDNMLDGYAHCKFIMDDQEKPADFVYLKVNKTFGELTGLTNVTGKKVTDLFPEIKEQYPQLFEVYGRVASTGRPEKIEVCFHPLNQWLSIAVYSNQKGYFTAIFENITERKRATEELEHHRLELEKRTADLEKTNATLTMMLDYARKAEIDIQERVVSNLRSNILGIVDMVKKQQLTKNTQQLIELLETTTRNLAHPIARDLESQLLKLTAREIQLANFIRLGKSTKELMVLLDLSESTIESHRNNLRKKLGLHRTKINLRTFLNSEFQ
jgi:PAS domain S-box-containing protein